MREFLRRYEEAGVDQVIFVLQAGRNRHEHIMESLELFGREVLPEFVERDEAATKAKAERLAPVVEAAMARKTDDVPRMPDDYVMQALPKQMVDAMHNDEAEKWLEDLADTSAAGDPDGTLSRGILNN